MILCFDIGGTTIKPAEATSIDDLRPAPRIPTPPDLPGFIAALRGVIASATTPPKALAFSIAGTLDDAGHATVANIPYLTGLPLRVVLERELSLPVTLANDADCFAMAEAVAGAGQGHAVVLGIILGTGIGGGVIVRGQPVHGAGEWGHGPLPMPVVDGMALPSLRCGCGQTGCTETLGSARGMERLHRHLHGVGTTSEAITAAWQAGDVQASRTITAWLDVVAGPLGVIANLLGPGVIVAGGGLSACRPLIASLDAAVRTRILRRMHGPLIVPASIRTEPGLVGAAALAFRA